MNQYEWIIATPRSNSACTLGSQEVGKLSLPSFSSCPKALQLSAAVIPATNIRRFRFMGTSKRAIAHDRRGLLQDMNREWAFADGIGHCCSKSGIRRRPVSHLTPARHLCGVVFADH